MKFGLLGKSISHSKSPILFNSAYPVENHTYELLDFTSAKEGVEFAITNGFKGINVTSPFKEQVMEFADYFDENSRQSQAANLLMFDNGKISAFNTDYYGVRDTIKQFVNAGMPALVLGCGGAGRAAAIALRDLGLEVTISNRSELTCKPFAISSKISYCHISVINEYAKSAQIIIDTIPVRHIILSNFNFRGKIVLEARYNNPTLEKIVKNDGGAYISGLTWLLNQAIPSFTLLTGREPLSQAMENLAAKW